MTRPPWELIVAPSAERGLARQPDKVAAAVVEFMSGPLLESPNRVGHRLRGELEELRAARRGPYRVVGEIDERVKELRVLRFDHRADVYRPRWVVRVGRHRRGSGPPFGPDSMTWRVNLEPVVFLGASRALLLQVAHPLVAAGVDQHSNYLDEPWARLFRTMDVMLKLSFGDVRASQHQASRLRRTHAAVRGVSPGGVSYDARDPALMTWVWATLVDTSMTVYQRAFGPLPPGDLDRYYGEQRLLGVACGIPLGAPPKTGEAFGAYVEEMVRTEVRVTPEAKAVARSIFDIWGPPVLGPSIGRLNRVLAAGLLPGPVRRAYGLTWDRGREAWLSLAFAAARAGARLTPQRIRRFPAAYLVRRS